MRRVQTYTLTAFAISVCGMLAGCEVASMVTRGFTKSLGPAGLAGGAVAGTTAEYAADGPRLTFQNSTSRPLDIRWWVGRVDVTSPDGVSDVRTGQHLGFTCKPGETVRRRSLRQPWPTGTQDAVVWVQVRQVGEQGEGEGWWMELPRPGPYKLRARECDGRVCFDRPRGGAEIVMLPVEAAPTGRNGEFPVYAGRQVSAGTP